MFSIPSISSLQFHTAESTVDDDFRYTDEIKAHFTDEVIWFGLTFKDNYWSIYVERKIPIHGIVHTLSSKLGDIPKFLMLSDAVRYCEYIKQGFQSEGNLYFVGENAAGVIGQRKKLFAC
jgi:hypothetical protein